VRFAARSLMVFFVLTAAPQLGFGRYLLPLQIWRFRDGVSHVESGLFPWG